MPQANRLLIKEINDNQDSGTAAGLKHNVQLIATLNGNLAKIVDIYKGVSLSVEDDDKKAKEGAQRQPIPA